MNAHQPSTTAGYGYDGAYPPFQRTGAPIFGYDASANWFTAFNFDPSAGNTWSFRQFTGQERDAESGLDYFGARYYAGALGRFAVPDEPLVDQEKYDPQSWNLCAYVRNNPLRSVDPDGRACDFAKGPNGENIITDREGKGCDELHDNTVHGDEPGLLMLAGIAEVLTDPHNVAQFVSDAGRATASLIAPQASATAECIFPGGDCDTTNLALAALPATGVTRFVKNRKLRNILAAFNRTGKGVGTGSTADAIRQELQTGMAVGGKYHYQKGVELRDALLNVLKSPGPDPSDRAVAKEALKDIQEAISRK